MLRKSVWLCDFPGFQVYVSLFAVPLVYTMEWRNDGVVHTPDEEHSAYDRHAPPALGGVCREYLLMACTSLKSTRVCYWGLHT